MAETDDFGYPGQGHQFKYFTFCNDCGNGLVKCVKCGVILHSGGFDWQHCPKYGPGSTCPHLFETGRPDDYWEKLAKDQKNDDIPASPVKTKSIKKSVIAGIMVISILAFFLYSLLNNKQFRNSDNQGLALHPVQIDAQATFSGTQFIIANMDKFDWQNVVIHLRSDMESGRYTFKIDKMSSRKKYTIAARQFISSNNDAFDVSRITTTRLQIFCDTPNGRGAFSFELNKK